jgi:diaminohydroxyphosphoribosylaminopyrimidine deaminase/5-amino-6-(5-phosphoribosylamino)uracil reductase
MTVDEPAGHMGRAIELARRGLFTSDPNPRVGCVLVRGGRIVGEGWHERAGGPHAERVALEQAGDEAEGATAYVTLEPCSHTGRTGPCTEALIAARVARVVCSSPDPDPRVAGSGIQALERAGIAVEVGLLERRARGLNPGYWSRLLKQRPLVRSKIAVSLDGRTALANGRSQWLTGRAAREDTHRWRARSSAVLTGIGTLLADDPALNARLADADVAVLQPARVVVDSRLRTPLSAKTLSLPGEVILFTCGADEDRRSALRSKGAAVETVGGEVRCDLGEIMRRLAELQYNEIWVEAGPTLNGALLARGLIDELVVYLAPTVLGSDGRDMFELTGLTSLAECPRFRFEEAHSIGDDLRVIGRPITKPGQSA